MNFLRFYSQKASVRPPVSFKFRIDGSATTHEKKKKNIPNKTKKEQKENNNWSDLEVTCSDLMEICPPAVFRKKPKMKKAVNSHREILYGIYPVLLALRAKQRSFVKLYIKTGLEGKNEKVDEILRLSKAYEVNIRVICNLGFKKLVGTEKVHQGVCLEATKLPFLIFEEHHKLEEFREEILPESCPQLLLYLDGINDPMNFGAILRTSYYLGVHKVLTSKLNSCPITNVVSKASSGASEVLPVYQVNDIERLIESLKELDWHIVSSSPPRRNLKSTNIQDFIPTKKNILLVIGNEGRGVSRLIEERSDVLLTIPSDHSCINISQSLNVSVATAILLHSLSSVLRKQ